MATYPTHGLHLRRRHPNRWLLLAIVVVAALVGVGAWALVDHYTGGTNNTTTGPATVTPATVTPHSVVADKYIAALEKLDPSALTPILDKNVVSTDWAYGSGPPFRSAKTLERVWAGVFATSGDAHFSGSLRAAGPHWAAVTFRLRGSTNPVTSEPFTMNGLSILNTKHGKIIRETYYWDVPGRTPGIAATVGRKFATALAAHKFGWARTLDSLYSKNAAEVDVNAATRNNVVPRSGSTSAIWNRWGSPALMPLHARLHTAGPSYRMYNGTIRNSWAVVNWVAKLHTDYAGEKVVSGVSILQLNKQGKIIRETLYY